MGRRVLLPLYAPKSERTSHFMLPRRAGAMRAGAVIPVSVVCYGIGSRHSRKYASVRRRAVGDGRGTSPRVRSRALRNAATAARIRALLPRNVQLPGSHRFGRPHGARGETRRNRFAIKVMRAAVASHDWDLARDLLFASPARSKLLSSHNSSVGVAVRARRLPFGLYRILTRVPSAKGPTRCRQVELSLEKR